MNERIKALRKALGLTQQKFADKIGVRQNTVAQYEIGRNPPNDTVITLIHREFGVSETWLRTGEGEMFVDVSRDKKIAAFLGDVMAEGDGSFKKQLIEILSGMSVEDWQVLEKIGRRLVAKQGEQQTQAPPLTE